MPDDDKREKPERQKAPAPAPPEPEDKRPVAEHEPLTITVVEPATTEEPTVQVGGRAATRIPHDTTRRIPDRPTAIIPVPRWYWVFVIATAALLYLNYRMVWAERFHYWLTHRLLPPQVVRVEDSIWRHTLGGPKHKD